MPLRACLEAPKYAQVQHDASGGGGGGSSSSSSTAKELHLKLDNVKCLIEPSSAWPSGRISDDEVLIGDLWIANDMVTFVSVVSNEGFALDYPSLSLHAVSRTMPNALQMAAREQSEQESGCIYCQISANEPNDSADGKAADYDEEDLEVLELWIRPEKVEQVESLFDNLSICASLHPSGATEEQETHPFATFGAFGTGIHSNGDDRHALLKQEGVFDDAEEEEEQMTATGKEILARLDGLVEQSLHLQENDLPASPTASFHSSDPRRDKANAAVFPKVTSTTASATLMLVNLPDELFSFPPLVAALLDLLHAYGELRSWTPLPSFGRAIVVYEHVDGAMRAKQALDRLLLPLMDNEDNDSQDIAKNDDVVVERRSAANVDAGDSNVLRAYYGDTQAMAKLSDENSDFLPVPTTDRNFLISPPGSPPVGWEPIREDPPNTNTLADDLIRALGHLRDSGLGVRAHTPEPLDPKDQARTTDGHRRTTSSSSLAPPAPPPSMIIPPRQAETRSHHPLAVDAYSAGGGSTNAMVDLPGVTVQDVDHDQDHTAHLDTRLNKGLSISSVKATVESMRGAPFKSDNLGLTGGHEKITPTARPPLGA